MQNSASRTPSYTLLAEGKIHGLHMPAIFFSFFFKKVLT